jgi:hypothetical protein
MSKSKYREMETKKPNWDKANERYRQYVAFSCKPLTQRLRADHIEDEDKSVKWNRQFVEDTNKKHDDEVKALNRKKNSILAEAHNMVKYLICDELDWKLTDDDIDRLFNLWYDRYHDDGFPYMCHQIEYECDTIRRMDWFQAMKERKA